MRTVLSSHAQVAHYWSNNVQEHGRSGNMFFEDGRIYSYGKHFCIARHIGHGTIAMTTNSYSVSTAKHISITRQAARHMQIVYCHDPDGSAAANRREALAQVESELLASHKPRIRQATRDGHKAAALHVALQYNEYLQALPEDEKQGSSPIDTSALDDMQETLKQVAKEKAAKEKKEREERAAQDAEKLEAWREHSGDCRALWGIPPALRISKDGTRIETSKGAEIPVLCARRLWPVVLDTMSQGKSIFPGIKLGVYTLNEISKNGGIRVGCHDIAFSELQGIAQQLQLV